MRSDSLSVMARMMGISVPSAQPLAPSNAALKQKGSDLVDHAGALANKPFAHALQPLKIELLHRFGGDKLHRGTQYSLGDRLRIAEAALRTFRKGANISSRHQPRVVAVRLELPAEVMCSDASRASTWLRESFCRRTIAPFLSRPMR
jgi:hypothetical protein